MTDSIAVNGKRRVGLVLIGGVVFGATLLLALRDDWHSGFLAGQCAILSGFAIVVAIRGRVS